MKSLLYLSLFGTVVAAGGVASYAPIVEYLANRNRPQWSVAEVDEGKIVSVVASTGEIKPVRSVVIGSFVSGPIKEIFVDFNDEVAKGDLLALVDPRLFEADVLREEAALKSREADVMRIQALLKQAERDEQRALGLQQENEDYISQTEIDQYVFSVRSLSAQLEVAQAAVAQARAALDNSRANLFYTKILAPIDGVIIERKIDPGQTLAAAFQTPELFVLAPDLEKQIHVFASVDEADIGQIMQAKEAGRRVQFTVDAWPGEVFEGEIEQIRISSTATQNVITYPVVVAAPNPGRKLLPGMTATISFEVGVREQALRISNKALRFLPQDRKLVRESDRDLLDGKRRDRSDDDQKASQLTAVERAAAKRRRRQRHVWVVDGEHLKAVEITLGIDDNKHTEIMAGELAVGDEVVTGVEPKKNPS